MAVEPGFRRFEFSEGGSNKFWEVKVEDTEQIVRFGKIGTAGQEKSKDFDSPGEAKADTKKLIAEKTGKGYTPGEDGAAYTYTSSEERDTGERPQLLNGIEESEVEKYINDSAWGMQEKKDGRRMLAKRHDARAENGAVAVQDQLTVDLPWRDLHRGAPSEGGRDGRDQPGADQRAAEREGDALADHRELLDAHESHRNGHPGGVHHAAHEAERHQRPAASDAVDSVPGAEGEGADVSVPPAREQERHRGAAPARATGLGWLSLPWL